MGLRYVLYTLHYLPGYFFFFFAPQKGGGGACAVDVLPRAFFFLFSIFFFFLFLGIMSRFLRRNEVQSAARIIETEVRVRHVVGCRMRD